MAEDSPRPPKPDLKQKQADADKAESRKQMRMLGAGLQLAMTVALFAAAGWWADEHWGWVPWGKLGIGMFGIVLGLYMFVKEAMK